MSLFSFNFRILWCEFYAPLKFEFYASLKQEPNLRYQSYQSLIYIFKVPFNMINLVLYSSLKSSSSMDFSSPNIAKTHK